MTIPSFFQSYGISFAYGTPAALGSVTLLGNLQTEVTAYTHSITAFGGFDSSTLTISDTRLRLEDWLVNGLGRHVVIHGDDLGVIWEGFVNQITYNVGALSVTVGPLMSIANRVSVRYSEVLVNGEDVTGTSDVTTIQEDTGSQSLYGIIEAVMSGGSLYLTEAEQVRDVFLQDKKYPSTSINLSLPQRSSMPSVQLNCRGYADWFEAFIYDDTTGGTVASSTKVSDIIDADPNSIVLNKEIDTNASLAAAFEDAQRTGLTAIKGCVNLGDGSDNRWLFGMREDRTAFFEAIPTSVEYVHETVDESQRITSSGGSIVRPWKIRAGKWIETRDVPVAHSPLTTGSDLRSNIRTTFIETVTYTVPDTISISGTSVDKAPQILAKYGIGAMV